MFSPIQVGSLTLKNRLIKSAATSMVSDDEQKAVAYHGRIAAGGMGAVLIEGSYDMLARLDKRTVSAAGQGSGRLTIEESPLQAICAEVHSHDCPCLIQMKTATPGIVYQWENMGPEGETHKASLLSDADIQMYIEDTIDGADALELRLGTWTFHETQFLGDTCFAGYGYDGTTTFGTTFDFSSHFGGILDGSHSGCGLIMGACKYVKQHVSIPVGGVVFMDPALASDHFEEALNDGTIDLIYLHRPVSNCDPEYANKLLENRVDEIAPCCRCLSCMGGPCRVNPTNGNAFTDVMPEGYEVPAGDGKKNVMVIGGGPAGMEAARVCAERGYDVTLYEKNGLGGLLDFAEMVKGKHESLGRLKNYLSHMLDVKGVTVVTGQEVDAAFVREQNPDVVIVATGAKRPQLAASGTANTPVVGVTDFPAANIAGQNVMVLGFNAQAVDTAHYLTAQGKKVTLVSEQPEMAYGTGQSMMLNVYVKPAFLAMGGKIRPESTLKSVGDGEVTLTTGFGIDVTVPCDCVIDASDMLPDTALADELGSEFDVYTVGDCETPLNIANAISTANLTARHC